MSLLPEELLNNIKTPLSYFKTAKNINYGGYKASEIANALFEDYWCEELENCGYEQNLKKETIKNWLSYGIFLKAVDKIDPELVKEIKEQITNTSEVLEEKPTTLSYK